VLDLVIAQTAAVQCGVFTRHQALSAGANDSLIRRRLRSGAWTLLRPGVYGFPDHRDTWDRRLWIVYLAAGGDAAVAYESAGAQYGTPGCVKEGLETRTRYAGQPAPPASGSTGQRRRRRTR